MQMKFFIVLFLISGIVVITESLVTGRIRIKGGRFVTSKSLPNNPILRSQSPQTYWILMTILILVYILVSILSIAVLKG
jgi:hypothetical protein